MLRFLRIRDLAVIEEAEVEFGPGLNVLTGETGAGKSILVEAVGLLLGARAAGDLVRTGKETATIEAVFDLEGDERVVRREITAQGRSRSFVDGALVTAAALREQSAGAVELHGQHEHQTLLDPSSHLALLDLVGGLEPLAGSTREAFDTLRRTSDALAAARREAAEREAWRELATFQLAELDRAALVAGEDEALAASRTILASAERLARLCSEAHAELYENEQAALPVLVAVWRKVAELASLEPRFEPYLAAREAIKGELEDLARFLTRYADGIDASPERLHAADERLALLERLKRKYGPSLADVIARRDALRRELDGLAHVGERISHLDAERESARRAYLAAARALSAARRTVCVGLTADVEAQLADLAMTGARFDVRFASDEEQEDRWSAGGVDRAEFYLSANEGEDLRPLARVASGGELSRVMLAMRTLTAASRRQGLAETSRRGTDAPSGDRGEHLATSLAGRPGLVFDEVDAGIGGRVADVVGQKLSRLARTFQVLCITHLPQIAAYADCHFLVAKHVQGGRTQTTITRLDAGARVEELGRMLGGGTLTEGIRASAQELLALRGELTSKGESERAKAKPRQARLVR